MADGKLTFLNAAFEQRCRAAGHDDYAALVSLASRGELVSESRSTHVTQHCIDDAAGESWDIHVKRYQYRTESSRSLWAHDKAALEARNYGLIAAHSPFHTPTVLAVGSSRHNRRVRESLLITETIPNVASLESVASDLTQRGLPVFDQMTSELARGLRNMHDAGFVHIDLQTRNILLQRADGGAYRIYLIDSTRGGLRRGPIRRHHGRIRDLSCLYKGARDWMTDRSMLRWYQVYRGGKQFDDADRMLFRTIVADRASKDHDAR